MKTYAPRPITSQGLLDHGAWRLKRYLIHAAASPPPLELFDDGVALAVRELPEPATAPGRHGVGMLILHEGAGAWYVVLGWWDRENELPLRVFVREKASSAAWRPARGGESVCVWDLDVIWFERNAWVQTVLSGSAGESGDAVARYLARTMPGRV